jgi:hypothetical protein
VVLGLDRSFLCFRVSMHRDADVESALRFWSEVVGVPTDRFQRTTLKKGNPKTSRRNTGADYAGAWSSAFTGAVI